MTGRAGARSRLTLGVATVAAVATTVSACGDGRVQAVTASSASASACAMTADQWPARVDGQKRRDTTADDPTVAAWGDPAIIARCGVTSPGPTTDPCVTVSGVDWVGHQLDDGFRFVTFGRAPAVEVLVPQHYTSGSFVLGAFRDAAASLPRTGHHCT